tara:strand:+ start:1332 stop:1778 length:447 start_codon:yes stop_codon:yes gene_type:complete
MHFPKLNLPHVFLKTKLVKGNMQVFDVVRKKYFKLTAEEWVRQHFIHYLNKEKGHPLGLMGVEKMVKYNGLNTRADIVLYNSEGLPDMIIECKAPDVKITQDTFNQIARYNFKLRVRYLVVTNGKKHFCCEINYKKQEINFLEQIPNF